jgi:hypothetical protein
VKPLFGSDKKPMKRRWRRATLLDLAQPEMRALIDLRFQPQFLARTGPRPIDRSAESIGRADGFPELATLPRTDAVPQRTSH